MDTRLALLLVASGSLVLALVYFVIALRARRRAVRAQRSAVSEAVLLPPVSARALSGPSQLDAGDRAPTDEPPAIVESAREMLVEPRFDEAAAAAYFGLTLEEPPAPAEPETDPLAVLLPRPDEATPVADVAAQEPGSGSAAAVPPVAPAVAVPTAVDDQIALIMAWVSEPASVTGVPVPPYGATLADEIRAPTSETAQGTPSSAAPPAAVEYRLVAPVELLFGDSEQRVGIRPGTPTFLKYQRLAAVLLNDLKRVAGSARG